MCFADVLSSRHSVSFQLASRKPGAAASCRMESRLILRVVSLAWRTERRALGRSAPQKLLWIDK